VPICPIGWVAALVSAVSPLWTGDGRVCDRVVVEAHGREGRPCPLGAPSLIAVLGSQPDVAVELDAERCADLWEYLDRYQIRVSDERGMA